MVMHVSRSASLHGTAVERMSARTGSYPIVSAAVDAATLRSMAWDSKGGAQSRHTLRASYMLTVAVDGLV
jgi:hypothetical protein